MTEQTTDTLPAWLYQQFAVGHILPFEEMGEADRSYWEHEAAAVRRAVARGGLKTPTTEAVEEQPPGHGPLWSLLDWSFWGAGMGDVFRMPLADAMLAAVPAETVTQAEQIMADFIERRNIEKTGVTVWQEQRDELTAFRALDLGDLDGRTSATCTDPTHPTWLRQVTDARGCGWCRAVELSAERDEVTKQRDQARRIAVTLEQETARLEALLAEMTHCRDNALRALYRDDVETDIDLEETIGAPFYGPGWDWDDSDLRPVVREAANAVRPAFGKLTQQRDKARARVAELEAERKKYVGVEPTIAEEMAYISNSLDAVIGLCHEQELAARAFELPVPEWIVKVREAADGLVEAPANRPALPWAHVMDDSELGLFLDDLVSAAMGRWRSDPDLPARTVLADVEKACADWRTPGQGYRSDEPGTETGDRR